MFGPTKMLYLAGSLCAPRQTLCLQQTPEVKETKSSLISTTRTEHRSKCNAGNKNMQSLEVINKTWRLNVHHRRHGVTASENEVRHQNENRRLDGTWLWGLFIKSAPKTRERSNTELHKVIKYKKTKHEGSVRSGFHGRTTRCVTG